MFSAPPGALLRLSRPWHAGTMKRRRGRSVEVPPSGFAGFRFPPEVILLAIRWYLRTTCRTETSKRSWRSVASTSTTSPLYRWVHRFTPELIDAARPCHHGAGDRWYVDETYVKVAGQNKYLFRAIDQFGQVIDVMLSDKRDLPAARRFFHRALLCAAAPVEVTTDKAAIYPPVIDELVPQAFHDTKKYANNGCEADHGRLKARMRPMLGLKTDPTTRVITAGHAFIQNVRRGHYELAVAVEGPFRLAAAFDELATTI